MCVITAGISKSVPSGIDVNLYSDMSVQQAAIVWLNNGLLKKFHNDKMSRSSKLVGFRKFLESNKICEEFSINQESYYYDLAVRVRDKLNLIFHSGQLQENRMNMFDIVQKALPGPGASLGTKETSFLGKIFQSQLTTYDASGSLYRYYSASLSYRLRHAELLRMKKYGLVTVNASKMNFAHKSTEEARPINTEASLEMLLQKGAAEVLIDLLKEFYNIDLSKQPKINKLLARAGSEDGSYATIDLTDGSNRISRTFAQWMLPKDVFFVMDQLRAKCIEVPNDLRKYLPELNDVTRLECKMFSTQGNGFNSAFQTLIFASLVEAVNEDLGIYPVKGYHGEPQDARTLSVFGDDIICTSRAFDKVTKFLEWAGFTVNRQKSFNTGCFRESCGADFFKGQNIRSVYIKRIWHERHMYSAFNRLCRWSAMHNIDLSHCLNFIFGRVSKRYVPLDEHDECGLKVTSSWLRSVDLPSNGELTYSGYHPVAKFVDAHKRFGNDLNELGFFVSILNQSIESTARNVWDKPYTQDTKPARYGFCERQRLSRYTVLEKSTSSWDWIPQMGLTIHGLDNALASIILD
jgi:hypothetical protein